MIHKFLDRMIIFSGFMGTDLLLYSRPEIRDGRYTGELAVPIIGDQKAEGVRVEATGHGIDLKQPYAYGDHLGETYTFPAGRRRSASSSEHARAGRCIRQRSPAS